jgi:hypothetical protein
MRTCPPLQEFILPGGGQAATVCHLARAVSRRAERHLVHLARDEAVTEAARQYLNRLSDLLFVMARVLARERPGMGRSSGAAGRCGNPNDACTREASGRLVRSRRALAPGTGPLRPAGRLLALGLLPDHPRAGCRLGAWHRRGRRSRPQAVHARAEPAAAHRQPHAAPDRTAVRGRRRGPHHCHRCEHADFPAAAASIPRVGTASQLDLERHPRRGPDLVMAWRQW